MSFGNATLVTLLSNSHWKKVTFCTFPKITWVLSLRNSTFDWLFIISVIVLWSSLVWKVFKVRVVGAQKLDNPAAHRTDQNELRSFYKKLLKPWKLPFARRNPRWNVSQPVKEKIFRIFSSAWLNWLNWQLHFWPQNFFKTLMAISPVEKLVSNWGEREGLSCPKRSHFLKNEANIGSFCTYCNDDQRRNSTHI